MALGPSPTFAPPIKDIVSKSAKLVKANLATDDYKSDKNAGSKSTPNSQIPKLNQLIVLLFCFVRIMLQSVNLHLSHYCLQALVEGIYLLGV